MIETGGKRMYTITTWILLILNKMIETGGKRSIL